jgi:hypothetical protein
MAQRDFGAESWQTKAPGDSGQGLGSTPALTGGGRWPGPRPFADRAVADEGWKIVLLTRLSPVFPFTLLNSAFGLTRVKLSRYVLASWLGMIPGTVMYVCVAEKLRRPGMSDSSDDLLYSPLTKN